MANEHPQNGRTANAAAHSTRICIKNLPRNFTSQQLRQFLLKSPQKDDQLLTLTDCRVLTDRRMAFCGFVDATQAAAAVRLFHRTYCQTSKLVVELALPPATTAKDKVAAEIAAASEKKLKAQAKEQSAKEPLLRSKTTSRKFWANDDEFDAPVVVKETTASSKLEVTTAADASSSDSESDSDSATDSRGSDNDKSDKSNNDDDSDSDNDSVDPLKGRSRLPKNEALSDMDFLRSKQVPLEDLANASAIAELKKKDASDTEDDSSEESDSESDDDGDQVVSKAPQKPETTAPEHDKDEHEDEEPATQQQQPNRLFVRNLPFTTTDDDLKRHFSTFGTVTECHIPVDDTGRSKGFAFCTFAAASDAVAARETTDGTDFQGRLLHVLPSRPVASHDNDSQQFGSMGTVSYKEQQEKLRRAAADKTETGWSASFVRGDAVVDNLAARLGLRKGDILAVKDGLSAGDAAVRLALGETAVIEENRNYFAEHGVDMEALVSLSSSESKTDTTDPTIRRSKTSMLVKNLPHDTNTEDLMKTFLTSGKTPARILLPPSRTIAVVEYSIANDAKVAFRRLAYKRFKSVPLYLEWVPLAAKSDAVGALENKDNGATAVKTLEKAQVEEEEEEVVEDGPTATLYVKNLNFATTEEMLRQFFSQHAKDVRAIRIPKKVAAVKRVRSNTNTNSNAEPMIESKSVSMGYGFVEFGSHASVRKVLQTLQGSMLEGHALELKPSKQGQAAASNHKGRADMLSSSVGVGKKNPTKLMVRNVPFQANRSELLKLFGSFGQLKKVRLPKKFDGSHRGFAFVEYLSAKEAAAAVKTLSRTHLYGRHLVLEWAATDEEGDDLQGLRDKAQRDQDGLEGAPKNKKIRFD